MNWVFSLIVAEPKRLVHNAEEILGKGGMGESSVKDPQATSVHYGSAQASVQLPPFLRLHKFDALQRSSYGQGTLGCVGQEKVHFGGMRLLLFQCDVGNRLLLCIDTNVTLRFG